MKVISKTYKYRLYPNKKQAMMLAEHFGCVRFVYNYFLNQRKEQYKNTKKSDNYYAQCKVHVNAAQNILDAGLKAILSAGTVDYTSGEKARANLRESRSSVKLEAHESLAHG